MGFWRDIFGGLFSGALKTSDNPATYEERVERYQKWQEEFAAKEKEQKKLEAELYQLQKRLSVDPKNTRYNTRFNDINRKLAKVGHEMSKLKNNLYLHKP